MTLAAVSDAAPIADVLVRGCMDLAAVSILAGALFLRRHRRQDLLAVYYSFNVGLFAILTLLSDSQVSVGVGFGIFGVLSIIRLRSEAYDNTEIAYFFLALAIALVNALPGRPYAMSIALDLVIVLTMYFVDSPDLVIKLHSCRVVLDRVYEDDTSLHADLERRLRASLEQVTVLSVDYVRETTTVDVRYRPGMMVELPTP